MTTDWKVIQFDLDYPNYPDLGVDRNMTEGKPFFYKYSRGTTGNIYLILYPRECSNHDYYREQLQQIVYEAYKTEKPLILIFHIDCKELVNQILSQCIQKNLGGSNLVSKNKSEEYINYITACSDPKLETKDCKIILKKHRLTETRPMITAENIMVHKPKTIYNVAAVDTIFSMMHQDDVGHYPVTDMDGNLLGLVSDSDLLPYIPPDSHLLPYPYSDIYRDNITRLKMQLGSTTRIADVMVYLEPNSEEQRKLTNVIYENEEPAEFLPKFFRSNKPAFNLLIVLDNETNRKLSGVLSWINILQKWEQIVPVSLHEEFTQLKAIDVAYEFGGDFPTATDDTLSAAAILEDREYNIVHRHFRVLKDDKLIAVYHFHELLPYQPVPRYDGPGAREMRRAWLNLQLDKLSPLHDLDTRWIPPDKPVWDKQNGDDVITKYLSHVVGENQYWRSRLAGLLTSVSGEKEKSTHLLNPYDIIKYLVDRLSQ